MSDVTCIKHGSATVVIGEDPEHGTLYRCLHDPDHVVAAPDGNAQVGWTNPKPVNTTPQCAVFRCLAAPTTSVTIQRSARRVELATCQQHREDIEAGKPYRRDTTGKLLMGADERIARGE